MLSILTIKLSIDNIMSVLLDILLTPSKAPIQQSAWLLKTSERENICKVQFTLKVINNFVETYIYSVSVCVSNISDCVALLQYVVLTGPVHVPADQPLLPRQPRAQARRGQLAASTGRPRNLRPAA